MDPLLRSIAPFVYLGMQVDAQAGTGTGFPPDEDLWQRVCFTLWRCLAGTVVLTRDGERWQVRPGQVGLSEPGMTAFLPPLSRANRLVFDILARERTHGSRPSSFGMREKDPQPGWAEIFAAPLPVLGRAEAMADDRQLVDELCNSFGLARTHLRTNARLHLWLVDRLEAATAATEADPAGFADRVDDLIRLLLRNGPTLNELADRLGVSRQTLLRRYRDERGHPPSEGLERIRLERATRTLAADPRQGMEHVAGICGFRSARSFARWFRTRTGLAPRTWRERCRSDGLEHLRTSLRILR